MSEEGLASNTPHKSSGYPYNHLLSIKEPIINLPASSTKLTLSDESSTPLTCSDVATKTRPRHQGPSSYLYRILISLPASQYPASLSHATILLSCCLDMADRIHLANNVHLSDKPLAFLEPLDDSALYLQIPHKYSAAKALRNILGLRRRKSVVRGRKRIVQHCHEKLTAMQRHTGLLVDDRDGI